MDRPQSDDWRQYPFRLVPGDSSLDFPAAEGQHPEFESDTWFVAGQLSSDEGREFAFLTIFNKNHLGHKIVADFYTFALFDLDNATYATYTDYDVPPDSMRPDAVPKLSTAVGELDISYESSAGLASWRACRDSGDLVPYTYDVDLVGADASGEPMELRLRVTPARGPVPLGATTHRGRIACFGQDGTYSYFQTGMQMTGTLRWGPVEAHVTGDAGHVDRQWFPSYAAAGGPGGDPRSRSHEWRTINLDNGVDLSIWRQFDRTNHNALQPFSGATTCPVEGGPECAEDVEVDIYSYVRWPESVQTLVPPPSKARYMPDRHRISSRQLDLDLTGEPLVAAPAHGLPIDYMEGPYWYHGTLRGQPVRGFAFYERTLAMHREWELVEVLATVMPEAAAEVRELLDGGLRDDAAEYLKQVDASSPEAQQLIADLAAALHA